MPPGKKSTLTLPLVLFSTSLHQSAINMAILCVAGNVDSENLRVTLGLSADAAKGQTAAAKNARRAITTWIATMRLFIPYLPYLRFYLFPFRKPPV